MIKGYMEKIAFGHWSPELIHKDDCPTMMMNMRLRFVCLLGWMIGVGVWVDCFVFYS